MRKISTSIKTLYVTEKDGAAKMKSVKDTAPKITEAEMITIVTNGKGTDMNGLGKTFTAAQIKGLADYYLSLAK
jgi:hypothetical protein